MVDLPLNHACDVKCDYEDESHRAMRRAKSIRNVAKAEAKGDQAWAHAREIMPALIKTSRKLSDGKKLSKEDTNCVQIALNLIIGELYLRRSQNT
jgi:hypothetical protein